MEDMNLQRMGYKCKEYLQFGRDDILPFITLNKSKKLCGNRTSFFYDEPDGKLLIWLHLSSTRYSENKVKKLNIVITPYIEAEKAEASTDYRLEMDTNVYFFTFHLWLCMVRVYSKSYINKAAQKLDQVVLS